LGVKWALSARRRAFVRVDKKVRTVRFGRRLTEWRSEVKQGRAEGDEFAGMESGHPERSAQKPCHPERSALAERRRQGAQSKDLILLQSDLRPGHVSHAPRKYEVLRLRSARLTTSAPLRMTAFFVDLGSARTLSLTSPFPRPRVVNFSKLSGNFCREFACRLCIRIF